MKKVLVIVVTYNGIRWLQRCLGSVPAWAQLFVFDNDSTDGSADFVAAHYAGSEHFSMDAPEVTALLRLASLILKDVPAYATAQLFGQGSRFLADEGGLGDAAALAKRVCGGIRPDGVFVAVLVSDLVYGFSNDDDADDNAGELLLSPQKTETLKGKWTASLDRLLRRFRNLFAILGTLFAR